MDASSGSAVPPHRFWYRAVVALGLAFGMYVAWTGHLPPAPKPATADPARFSAERAMVHVREMARAPHPAGSKENDRVRDYIIGQLAALGADPQVQEVMVHRGPGQAATVQNVLARLPGTDSGGAVVLLAHYDSVAFGPGAADDVAGCAALLEALRAVKAGAPPRNDLIFLFTDGEEGRIAGHAGLRGAYGFTMHHHWAKEAKVAVNFDCRGNQGPSYMYECSAPNRWLVRQLNRADTRPVATSVMFEIYSRMPLASDLTAFLDAGIPGMNFAFIHRLAHYHTALDTPENLSLKSLQHHGENALGMARQLGDNSLAGAGEGANSVYFYLPLVRMVQYGLVWVWPLAALAAALYGAVVFAGLRRGRMDPAGIVFGLGLHFTVWLVCALIGLVIFWTSYQKHSVYFVYPALALTITALAAAGALFCLVMGLARKRLGLLNLCAAALLPWLFLLALVSWKMPGASYLFLLPLLTAVAGLWWMVLHPEDPEHPTLWGAAILTLLGMPALFFITGTAQGLYSAILLLGVAGQVSLFLLLLGAVLPQLAWMAGGHLRTLSLIFLAAGVGGVYAAGPLNEFSPERPKLNSLTYALNADTGQGFWLSCDAAPDEWTAKILGDAPRRGVIHDLLPLATRADYLRAAAPEYPLVPPSLEVLGDAVENGVRTLKLRVDSQRGAEVLEICANPGLEVVAARLNGAPLLPVEGRWFLCYSIYRGGGLELELDVEEGRTVQLQLTDFSYGLPEQAGVAPRPPHMIPKPNTVDFNLDPLKTDETVVTRAVKI